jgi:AcrR family transcriptional regulator
VPQPRSATYERILDAACERIATDGIDAVRIARIAQDAGVSTALIHYHFETREALLAAALRHSYERAGRARIAGDDPAEPPAVRLGAMVERCLPTSPDRQRDWALWVELWLRAVRHPELRPVCEQLYARMHRWFERTIQEGIDRGDFQPCDVDSVVERALALNDGLGLRALLGDQAMPLDRARREVGGFLARQLGIGDALPGPGKSRTRAA